MADDLVRLCGLYEVESKRTGNTYLTGRLNKATRLVIFKNTKRERETDPHWSVFIRQDTREPPAEKPTVEEPADESAPF